MAHKKINKKKIFIVIIALVVPFFLVLTHLKIYSINFWYDPSRDLLTAWNNLTKPTLIGPTTGIPGLYYGPYWIWLLSFGLLFSKNPVYVAFIIATLQYLIIFPLIWFRLSKYLDRTSLIIGWLLFILGNGITYATQLWNPYPAPLITLAALALLISTDLSQISKKSLIYMMFVGILLALVINFHVSFGITLLLSTFIFLVIDTFIELRFLKTKNVMKTRLRHTFMTVIGLIIGFLPTIAFELRHNFLQIRTLLLALIKYGGVVNVIGLSKTAILDSYFKTFGKVIHVNDIIAMILFIFLLIVLLYQTKNKKVINYSEIRIGLLSLIILLGSAFIYFTAKNPIWEYHFIGVDIAFLLFVTFAASQMPLFRKILLAWTAIIIITNFYQLEQNINGKMTYFEQQKAVVETISQDAKNSDYSLYSYSKSIYMYDYAYLFKWLARKNIPYDPGFVKKENTIYLILPSKENAYIIDFIHNRAPQKKYYLVKSWHTDEIIVMKFVKR